MPLTTPLLPHEMQLPPGPWRRPAPLDDGVIWNAGACASCGAAGFDALIAMGVLRWFDLYSYIITRFYVP